MRTDGTLACWGGAAGDVPVPGDYDGDGTADVAIYQPSKGTWYVRNQFEVTWGDPGDIPAYRPQYLVQWR